MNNYIEDQELDNAFSMLDRAYSMYKGRELDSALRGCFVGFVLMMFTLGLLSTEDAIDYFLKQR